MPLDKPPNKRQKQRSTAQLKAPTPPPPKSPNYDWPTDSNDDDDDFDQAQGNKPPMTPPVVTDEGDNIGPELLDDDAFGEVADKILESEYDSKTQQSPRFACSTTTVKHKHAWQWVYRDDSRST